jgi:hypothetical protein
VKFMDKKAAYFEIEIEIFWAAFSL